MIYLVLFLFFLFPIFFCDYKLWNYGNSYERGNIYQGYYIFLLVLVVLLFGLRNYVGGDTIGYMDMWKNIPFVSELPKFDFLHAKYQPFWYIFSSVCKSITGKFWVFQIVHAAIVNSIIFYTISRYCQYRFTVIFIYAVATMFYFNCEILRESLSLSFGLLGLAYYNDKKWLPYYIFALIALAFHKSATILLFLPLLYKFTTTTINVRYLFLFIVVGFVFSTFLLDKIVVYLFPFFMKSFDKYSKMANATMLGNIRAVLIVCLLAYLLKCYENTRDGKLKNAYVCAKFYLLMHILGLFLPIFTTRFSNYFEIFYIILLGDFIWNHYGAKKILVCALYANFVFSVVKHQTRDVSDWVSSTSHGYYFYQRYYPYYSIFDDIPYGDLSHRKNIYYQERLNNLQR